MHDLAVQVGAFDAVGIDQTDATDPGGREVDRGSRTEGPDPDHEHGSGAQAFLSGGSDLGQHHLADVAFVFLRSEHRGQDSVFRLSVQGEIRSGHDMAGPGQAFPQGLQSGHEGQARRTGRGHGQAGQARRFVGR